MNPLANMNVIERNLCNIADMKQIPISGTFELLPLCNMDCKMCFARMSNEELHKSSKLHSYKEWLEIAKKAVDAGCMFLLLTGGEPFMYPHFKELYTELKKLGLVLTINTNGTLINEDMADFLAKNPPRRLNITIYGASDETYAKLCGNPKGFTQLMKTLQLLKERNISVKLNCSITPLNVADLDAIYDIAKTVELPIESAYYLMPAIRENNQDNVQYRLTPKQAAEAKLKTKLLNYGEDIFKEYLHGTLQRYYDDCTKTIEHKNGYTCRAGNSVFWVDFDGTFKACSFTKEIGKNVFEEDFNVCWNALKEDVKNTKLAKECCECHLRVLCSRCAASAYSEHHSYSIKTKYHCELTKHFLKLLEEKAKEYHIYED